MYEIILKTPPWRLENGGVMRRKHCIANAGLSDKHSNK